MWTHTHTHICLPSRFIIIIIVTRNTCDECARTRAAQLCCSRMLVCACRQHSACTKYCTRQCIGIFIHRKYFLFNKLNIVKLCNNSEDGFEFFTAQTFFRNRQNARRPFTSTEIYASHKSWQMSMYKSKCISMFSYFQRYTKCVKREIRCGHLICEFCDFGSRRQTM